MMNDTFDFKRFGQLLAYDGKKSFRTFGLTLLVLCCFPVLLWIISFLVPADVHPMIRRSNMYVALLLCVVLFPAKAFGDINLSREGVSFAMLPASKLEKFFSMVSCSLLAILAVVLGFYLVDAILTLLPFGGFKEFIKGDIFSEMNKQMTSSTAPHELAWEETIMVTDFITKMMRYARIFIVITILTINAFFLLGNTLFKKHKTAKTIAIFFGISWALSLIFSVLLIPFGGLSWMENIMDSDDIEWIFGMMNTIAIVSLVVNALIALGLYVATHLKLKNQKY